MTLDETLGSLVVAVFGHTEWPFTLPQFRFITMIIPDTLVKERVSHVGTEAFVWSILRFAGADEFQQKDTNHQLQAKQKLYVRSIVYILYLISVLLFISVCLQVWSGQGTVACDMLHACG